MSKQVLLTIRIDPEWLNNVSNFGLELEAFLHRNAPCQYCGGKGFLDEGEMSCGSCGGDIWENVIIKL